MKREKQLNGTAAEVETAFYDALGRGDVVALMALWADDEEIVCVHPGGQRLHGHAAIQASWEQIFAQGGLAIHPVQLHETHNLMSSVHSVIEGASMTDSGPAHLVATNVYIKTPRGWRIVMHHVSLAPGPVPAETQTAKVLH